MKNLQLLGIRIEHRIGGRLQSPLSSSAESFVDESHIVFRYIFSLFSRLKTSSLSISVWSSANLQLHWCGIYEYLNELASEKEHTKTFESNRKKFSFRINGRKRNQYWVKLRMIFRSEKEHALCCCPAPFFMPFSASCLTHASLRIFHPIYGMIRPMCHAEI